jgi:hypothetical protein
VTVGYSVDAETPIRLASGMLLVELVPIAKRMEIIRAPSLASTLVTLEAAPAAEVSFEPTAVKGQVIRHFRVTRTKGATLTVALAGNGLKELAAAFSGPVSTARLYSDSGNSVRATIRDLHATADDQAEAKIAITEIKAAGAYHGKFPLLVGSRGGQLEVTVDVQEWFWLAFLLVFGGVVVGWWATHRAGIRRRKDVMRAWLISRIQMYEAEAAESGDRPASFDLAPELGPTPRYGPGVRCGPFPSGRTARELLCRIADARSDDDLKDDEAAVAEMVESIESFLEVEPPARGLKDLLAGPPDDRGNRRFRKTIVGADGERFLAEAQVRPKTAEDARSLARRLQLQAEVWKLAVTLWTLQLELEKPTFDLTPEQRKLLAENDVDKVTTRAKVEEAPTIRELFIAKTNLSDAILQVWRLQPPEMAEEHEDEQERLPSFLEELVERTAGLEPVIQGGNLQIVTIGAAGGRALILGWIARLWLSITRVVRRMRGGGRAIRRASVTGLSAAITKIGAGVHALRDFFFGGQSSPTAIRNRWTRRDLFLTAIAVAVSAIAYALTVYDATWGSRDDLLTAFTAGFLGKVGIDWADQLMSRSFRVRRVLAEARSAKEE